ncbi:MAG: hypothetical protein JNM56_20945, partial [Planctomycetia bacterium]|nr:hypothetical protein [Planctomycetia bacterium]
AGCHPAHEPAAQLFQAVLAGEHRAQGCPNPAVRGPRCGDTQERTKRRQQSAAVGRRLQRLPGRGLSAPVPHPRRWRVTDTGRRILGDTLGTARRSTAPAA